LPVIPFADFFLGSLLTLLLPVLLLIALVVWYYLFSRRVPETADAQGSGKEPAVANPGPPIPESLPPQRGA
jgi:hypothetical protein